MRPNPNTPEAWLTYAHSEAEYQHLLAMSAYVIRWAEQRINNDNDE